MHVHEHSFDKRRRRTSTRRWRRAGHCRATLSQCAPRVSAGGSAVNVSGEEERPVHHFGLFVSLFLPAILCMRARTEHTHTRARACTRVTRATIEANSRWIWNSEVQFRAAHTFSPVPDAVRRWHPPREQTDPQWQRTSRTLLEEIARTIVTQQSRPGDIARLPGPRQRRSSRQPIRDSRLATINGHFYALAGFLLVSTPLTIDRYFRHSARDDHFRDKLSEGRGGINVLEDHPGDSSAIRVFASKASIVWRLRSRHFFAKDKAIFNRLSAYAILRSASQSRLKRIILQNCKITVSIMSHDDL